MPPSVPPEAEILRLVLPCLPDMALSGNKRRRGQFWEQATVTKAEKKKWGMALYVALAGRRPGPFSKARLSITLHFKDARRRDSDNLWGALKPLLDVLCVAQKRGDNSWRVGVLADDSTLCLVESTLRVVNKSDLAPMTVVELQAQLEV